MITLRRYNDFFGYTVPWYSIFVGIAVAAMGYWLYLGLKRDFKNIDENKILFCFPLSLLFGVITAAVFDTIFRGTWKTWINGGVKEFGFTFFGWAIGVLCFSAAWGKIQNIGAKRMVDFFAPSLALAQAFGRIGCFLGGCCYGCPSDKLGFCYPPGSLPYEKVGNVALFPVQLVESLMLFLLFYLCVKVNRKMRCSIYLIVVSINRCILECFRYDNRGIVFNQNFISPSQTVSIILFFIGIVMLYYSLNTINDNSK